MSDHGDDVMARMLKLGLCDAIGVERANGLAFESGLSRPQALVQLGLVSERALAELLANLFNVKVASSERYPAQPILLAQLRPRFLRAARAVPVAIEAGSLVLVTADPTNPYVADAVGYATGLPVCVEVGVPIELESALDRLYP